MPDDGHTGPKHVAHGCITLKWWVWLHTCGFSTSLYF